MKISHNWLKQFIAIKIDVTEISKCLTNIGLEVEKVTPIESVKGSLKGVFVGQVLTCKKHPNADKLNVTTVDIGKEKPLQIVCGAPNIASGQKVPVVVVGATLYDEHKKPWKIKKSKIREVLSQGMICSEVELGLDSQSDGICVLNSETEVGIPCKELFEIETDTIFEINITPNRADALSHLGVARDLFTYYTYRDKINNFSIPKISKNFTITEEKQIRITIDNNQLTPRYCGVVISNVKTTSSPKWLKNRLTSIGLTPKNLIVDITNYVLHEIGQPLHAFDYDKLPHKKIIVKNASEKKFKTLDGIERTLHSDDLMIYDNQQMLCMAGVLGGISSAVSNSTKTVFLESACFDPISIRKTAKRHAIHTDSSFRYERSIDPNLTLFALKRAIYLFQTICNATISSEIIDLYPKPKKPKLLTTSYHAINKTIGNDFPQETIRNILSALDIIIKKETNTHLDIAIPTYRIGVETTADIIEEILRVYGYDNVKENQRFNFTSEKKSKIDRLNVENTVANILSDQGFFELKTNSLTSKSYNVLDDQIQPKEQVTLLNPLSNELSSLRQNLLFSNLEAIVHNINRKQYNLKVYEFGKTYHKLNQFKEIKHLTILSTGNNSNENWHSSVKETDFYFIKGIVQNILDKLKIKNYQPATFNNSIFSQGLIFSQNKTELVKLGLLSKKTLEAFNLSQDVYYADILWDNILDCIQNIKPLKIKEIPKFPEVKRDLSLLIDSDISFKTLEDIAKKTEKNYLTNVLLFDVYQGKHLPSGKKSYALRFILQDQNKTLTEERVQKIMASLQQQYEKQIGATLRQ